MPSALARPSVSDVHGVLSGRNALIVHFSGSPKGAGRDRGFLYPADLQHVLHGRANGGVSCSTVMPGDVFHGVCRNATGCMGVIVDLMTPTSLTAVSHDDCGSIELPDGTRTVANPVDIHIKDVEDSIVLRRPGCYNEWVVRDFRCVGIFAVHPYEISTRQHLSYPNDMPDWLTPSEPDLNIVTRPISAVSQDFPGMRIFTFCSGRIVDALTLSEVRHEDLYSE